MSGKYDRYFVVVGAGRNRKFVRLTDSERCAHFLGILAIAAQSSPRGYLLVSDDMEAGPEEIASEAGGGVTPKVARSAMEKLQRVGVLVRDEDAGAWFVHDWGEVNPDPKKDSTNAERQAAWRARRAALRAERNAVTEPLLTPPVTGSNAGEVEVEVEVPPNGGSARGRARPPVIDQTQRPEGFPDSLVAAGQEVMTVLRRIWKVRGGAEPMPRSVGLAIMRNEKADHVAEALELEQFMTTTKGLRVKCGDIAKRYGDKVSTAPARDTANGNGRHLASAPEMPRDRLIALSNAHLEDAS